MGSDLTSAGAPVSRVALKTHLRLLTYVWPHWRGLAVLLVTMALAVGLEVLRPWPTKLLVDNVLGQQPLPSTIGRMVRAVPGGEGTEGLLLWVCISTVVIFLAGTTLGTISNATSIEVGRRMTYELGADLFLHLQRLSLRFHSKRLVGDTIARVTGDPQCVQTLVTGALLPLFQALLKIGAMFAVMWQLQPTLTLLSLGVVPFLMLAVSTLSHDMKHRSRERRDLEVRIMSLVQQAFVAIPAIQAFTREELEHARFRQYADETLLAYRRSMVADTRFKLAVGFTTTAGTAIIMYIGASYALQGKITTGTILVFLSYLGSLYAPLNSIIHTYATLQRTAVNGERVLEILDTPHDVQDLPDARVVTLRGHVRYDNVSFGYEPETLVVRNISLEARPGETVAIVGPTGAGKSTLVSLLVRFFDAASGRITVDGIDIREIRLRSLREQIAIVLQEPFLFRLTVAENIAYGRPSATSDEIVAAAVAANADEFIRRLPQDYDTVIGERGTTLSGGEKQRLSIARAFLKDAPILILDEPTSALDARTEHHLLEAVRRLMKGRTTFIIAHRLSTIRGADRILVMDRGEIVEVGSNAELLTSNGLYASLYRQQMEMTTDAQLGNVL